ncbi:MAG TPA: VOC family protein [Opitutaceae bacterium]|nr:VOC family protein [Opitutaceae bacterium]
MNVTGLAFTGYPITDVPRARAFYEGVLGLRPGTVFQHEQNFWIEYEVGAGTLAVSNMSAGMWKPSPDGPSAALEVEDFDAAARALRAAGAKFVVEPMDSGPCRMAIVADPDGNSLIIHHRKQI